MGFPSISPVWRKQSQAESRSVCGAFWRSKRAEMRMVECRHVGNDPFCSGGDVSCVNQLPAHPNTAVRGKQCPQRGFEGRVQHGLGRAAVANHAPLRQEFTWLLQSLDAVCELYIKNQMIRSISVGLRWPPLHPPFFKYI